MAITKLFSQLIALIAIFLSMTSAFDCPEVTQCRCRKERSFSDNNLKLYNVIECKGHTGESTNLDLSSVKDKEISRLLIMNSSISQLENNTFKDMRIRSLEVKNTDIKIGRYALLPLALSLNKLVLENVGILFKPSEITFLKDLVHLTSLSLDGNGEFPVHWMARQFKDLNLHSLKTLSLRNCNIAKVADTAFEGLEALQVLDLSENYISAVPGAILLLRNLRKLFLSHNQKLYYIHDYAFRNLNLLEEIEMSHTQVHTVSDEAFMGLEKSLQTLIMDHGQLPDGHFVALKSLHKLRVLDISYNKISAIHNESFEGFRSLEQLDISGQFEINAGVALRVQFTDSMFRGLENKLKILKIRNLALVSLPIAALAPLRALETLDASNNEFTEIFEGFFDNIHAKMIVLKNMEISEISAEAFDGLPKPVDIIFDGNNVTNISFILEMKPCAFGELSFLDNPVSCDCDVIEIAVKRRVRKLLGECAEGMFAREDLKTLRKVKDAREVCDIDPKATYLECSAVNSGWISSTSNFSLIILIIQSIWSIK